MCGGKDLNIHSSIIKGIINEKRACMIPKTGNFQ